MAKFSTQYSLAENGSGENYVTSPIMNENIVIKDEESDGISNLGYSDDITQIKRKRKMPGISESSSDSQFFPDTVSK